MSRVSNVVEHYGKGFKRTGAIEITLSEYDKEQLAALLEDISRDDNYIESAQRWAAGLLKEIDNNG